MAGPQEPKAVAIPPVVAEKLEVKHGLSQDEVFEVLQSEEEKPYITFAESGHIEGEEVYRALGRSEAGRYLFVIFIYKKDGTALVISARDMNRTERSEYAKAIS